MCISVCRARRQVIKYTVSERMGNIVLCPVSQYKWCDELVGICNDW